VAPDAASDAAPLPQAETQGAARGPFAALAALAALFLVDHRRAGLAERDPRRRRPFPAPSSN
jgi:hypothetical protein